MAKRILLAIGLILLVSSPLMAAPLLTVRSLADYIALGSGGGQIDDKLFYDFQYAGSGFGGAVAIPASGVWVTPIITPFNPGLIFNTAWSVGPGQGLDSAISFKVQVLPGGAPITDISATMAGYGQVLDGVVSVSETTNFGNIFLYDTSGGTLASDEITFDPTTGIITVVKDIAVNGNNGVAAFLCNESVLGITTPRTCHHVPSRIRTTWAVGIQKEVQEVN